MDEEEFIDFMISERISRILEEMQTKKLEKRQERKDYKCMDDTHTKEQSELNAWIEEQGKRELYSYKKGVEDGIKLMKKITELK